MNTLFTVDGIAYDVIVPENGENGLKRKGSVLDGEKAGRLLSGSMERDIIGTYYNYTLQIETNRLNPAAYDALFEVLTAPVDYHMVSFPYGQDTLAFKAYVANVEDTLKIIQDGVRYWGGVNVNFVAMDPART